MHWYWLSPAGGCQQGPSRSKQCLGRASGGKEDLSGKGVSGSRQVGTMAAVEVSMVGHWQSRGARRWHRKQNKKVSMGRLSTQSSIKRRVWGG